MKYLRLLSVAVLLLTLQTALPVEAAAKDQWIQVRSKNFFLIGNASEKEVRRVATKLEQFRESFRLLFAGTNLTAAIPTNVVVFKSGSSYKPFKPKRANGKIDEGIAGYFQPGDDVNYITLSVGGEDRDVYGTIYHEYVHFIVNTNLGKSEVPTWFNEGLAEYYQTYEIADDIKLKLGLPQAMHLELLKQSKLIPIDQLMAVTNYQLHQTGGHSRSIFYAQSWALIHYLMQSGKVDALNKYLSSVVKGADPKNAFESAFQTTYARMEKDLRAYVSKGSYQYQEFTLKYKLQFDAEMQVQPLSEGESNAYLGDLLYHINRADDAEPFLADALKAEPSSGLANTAMGMVKIRQRKFDEARGYLEKAIATDPRNHIAYYRYAYLLSREGRDEFGMVRGFEAATAAKMREMLRKAITIAPAFGESYDLLAFVSLVNNDGLDEAAELLKTALKHHPGHPGYAIRLAEVYGQQKKYADAEYIAKRMIDATDDESARQRANSVLSNIKQMQAFEEMRESSRKQFEAAMAAGSGDKPRLTRRESPAETARRQDDQMMASINEALREPEAGEDRVVGRIEKIDCSKRPVTFSVRTQNELVTLTTADFQNLILGSLGGENTEFEVGCNAKLAEMNAVITFRTSDRPGPSRGQLIAIEFVPENFRMMTAAEVRQARRPIDPDEGTIIIAPPGQSGPPPPAIQPPGRPPADAEAMIRDAMLNSIRSNLTQVRSGERQEMGMLEKVDCSDKAMFFHIRIGPQVMKLKSVPQSPPRLVIYAPDLNGVQFGCGLKAIEFPAVVTFKPDAKNKRAGDLVGLEFVPKSFTLN